MWKLTGLLVFLTCGLTAAYAEPATVLAKHMQYMLTDGDQWRTPNPDYDPERGGPHAFGLRFELAPDGTHVTGNLTGLFEDDKEVVYWSLLALYNPVTGKVVTQQIGWDGTLLYGEVPPQPGTTQIVDMISYGADGKMSISRHQNNFKGRNAHSSVVFERDAEGVWKQAQDFIWIRHPAKDLALPQTRADSAAVTTALGEHVGFLMTGSGQWRSPNPAYQPGKDIEQFYGMNYRWGPNRQHIVGEIVSYFDDGRERKEWTLFITHNPVTGIAYLEQTGAGGVYFRGELGTAANGRHSQTGLIYMPNGTVKSVRDEIEIIDDSSYISHVFERDEKGTWTQVREWTWRQVDNQD